MFFFIHELVGYIDLQKQPGGIDLVGGARLFMLSGLPKIGTVARAIERHLSLLAATLGANAPVNGGTESLLLADFTDGAAQWNSCKHYCIPRQWVGDGGTPARRIALLLRAVS